MYQEAHSPEETRELGRRMGEKAVPGQIFCLDGDLGAGKTVFTKGFAEGLGVKGTVNSPTFTILQVYTDGRIPLYHFDVYRLGDPSELEELGYEEYFFGDGVCLIEWSDMVEEYLPEDAVKIRMKKEPEKGFSYRLITLGAPEQDGAGTLE